MSNKKVLTSIKDENQDLQKQMGCISGFFQLFDRHWFLNKASSGGTNNDVKELNNTMQKATEKNVKAARENQQFSTESSVTSVFSSSCSSSMSSLEFNRTIQVNAPSIIQIEIPENSKSGVAVKQLDTPGHQSLDFYDVVKESLRREAQGLLSVKTAAKEEKKGHILKYIDSPRPLQAAKSGNSGVMVTNEPFYIPAKSRKTPWDSPRHSYDERDIQNILKGITKHKEIARLSLDGREATKSHNLVKAAQKGYASSSTMLRQQQQEPETSRRPSSVVAKLMGLDAFPESTQACHTPPRMSSCGISRDETSAKSRMSDGYSQHQSPVSSVTSKGSTLVMSRKDDASITIVSPYSRYSLEPTPWRHPDASQDSHLQVSEGSESSIKSSHPALSVYGQIEKRVADLQFKNSGKDLRALKHILEAMQKYKDSLDITREQASNYLSDRSLSESSKSQSPRRQQKEPTSVTDEMSNSTQGGKLPIVIMKPAQVTIKINNPASTEMLIHRKSGLSKFIPGNDKLDRKTAKGISPTIRQSFHLADKSNKMRTSKLMQSSKIPQDVMGENTINSGLTAETRSPRVQKKFGLERRSPTTPSSDSNNNRRQLKESLESSSPSTTPRKKVPTLQQRNERFSKISCQRASDFDGNRSTDSHSDTETIQVNHSEKNNSIPNHLNGLNQNNATKELSKDSNMAETTVAAEQPSPVSVLDAAFYIEDPPSPVKKKSEISQDLDEVLTAYDSGEDISDLSSKTTKANFSNGTNDNDFQTQNLVQILQQIDYNDQKFINSLESKDPDHKYISEILVASGLLGSPSPSHAAHSSGHPINPKLFLALEQIKSNKMHFNVEQESKKIARMNYLEKMQRKLIFDAINDVLLQKLIMESSSTLWCLKNQPAAHKLNGQQLLHELCRKVDELQGKNRNVDLASEDENLTSLLWKDLMHCPETRTECKGEIPYIVLDIERLIFKDLITEVVRGEVASHPGNHCRQLLFPK